MADCGFIDVGCKAEELAKSAIGDAIENMANAVLEAFGKAVASLGTLWVNVGTPNLTGSGGASSTTAGAAAPNSENITMVLNYVMWISLAAAVISLFILGGLIAFRMRAGEGIAAVGKLGLILASVVFISGASAIVSGVLPNGPSGASGTVAFLQSSLWWYMGAAAVLSVIIGAARMVWEQRAEPGRETIKSLLTLVVVAGSGVTIVGLLVTAADSFSVWIINGSLNCDVTTDGGACFGTNMANLLALTTNPAAGGLGALLIIILGLIAILATTFQIILMVARGGMLVILTGILPLAASATNTEMGKAWFKKCISWLVAFILYKPAAAIVYAAAFQLVGTDVFKDDGTGLLAVLTGLMLMVIALFAMPALMRFVTPLVGAMSAGAGGAMAMGAMAALPSGAASIGRLASGGGSAGSSGSDGASGSSGSAGPSGSSTTGGPSAPQPVNTNPSSGGSNNPSPAGGGGQPAPVGGASSGAGGAGAGAGSGAAGAGAGAAAGGSAAAAGAAGGPVGMAAGAALDVAKQAGQAAAGAAQSIGQQAAGEGDGPSGS